MIKLSYNNYYDFQIDFKNLIKNILDFKEEVPSVELLDIKEYNIGKSYFYSIMNKEKFFIQIEINKKTKIFCIYDILNFHFSKTIPLNNASIAFKKNHSYLNLFEPHRKNYHFIRLDIRGFFHSIDVEDIKKVFKPYFQDTKKNREYRLDTFVNLVTYEIPNNSSNEKFKGKRVLPMGFKTSPIISNIIFRQLDIQIQKLCSDKNIVYTRYADDMLFSSSKDLNFIHSESFVNEIRIIIAQLNFELNEHKTIKSKHTLSLNGYTIEYGKSELRLSNKKTNIIKKMIYMIDEKKESADVILKKLFQYKIKWKSEPLDEETYEKYHLEQLLNKVLGYRSYLLSIIQFNKKYHCTSDSTIKKYSNIIYEEKIIDEKKVIVGLEVISDKFQNRIVKLEKIIEKNKPFHRMAKIQIDSLDLTDGIKDKLKKENYKNLKDLYKIKKEDLRKIRGIGTVKAENIIEIIENEIKKYK